MFRIATLIAMLFATPAWAQQGSLLTQGERAELQGSCRAEAQTLAARQPQNNVFNQRIHAFEYYYSPSGRIDANMLNGLNRSIERNLAGMAARRVDQLWGAYENCLTRIRIGQIQRRLGMARPAAPAQPAQPAARNAGGLAPLPASTTPVHDCVEPGTHGTTSVLRNKCGFKIMVSMCVVGPPPESAYAYNDCEKGQRGGYDIGALGMQAAIYRKARTYYWFACRMPQLPYQIRYEPGRGHVGLCK